MTRFDKIFWLLLLALGLALFALVYDTSAAPVPKKPKTFKHAEVTQGLGAAALIAPAAVPVLPKQAILTWNWHESGYNYWTNVVFNVYARTSLTDTWQHIDTTAHTNWPFVMDQPWMFYTVTASNVMTEMENPNLHEN